MSLCRLDNHVWLWAGSGEIPAGYKCDCKAMEYKLNSQAPQPLPSKGKIEMGCNFCGKKQSECICPHKGKTLDQLIEEESTQIPSKGKIEKLNLSEYHGYIQNLLDFDERGCERHEVDDNTTRLELIQEKLNEIIDVLNERLNNE